MNYKRELGLHLRLYDNLSTLAQEAIDNNIKSFQFFLTKESNKKYLKITQEDLATFLTLKKAHFTNLYIHSSYWINLSSGNKESLKISQNLLKKEINAAKKLNIKHLILHPGSAIGHKTSEQDPFGRDDGIATLANSLNKILKKEDDIYLLLENTAHGNKTVGSNLKDFTQLRKLLENPEKIKFCLDLSHAFAYGYDLENKIDFIDIINENLGIENIKLIHLNDSAEKQGSMLDRHEIPGQGLIGKKVLKNLINDPKLKNIPIIVEPSSFKKEKLKEIIQKIHDFVD